MRRLRRALRALSLTLLISCLLFAGASYQVLFRATFPRSRGTLEIPGLREEVEVIRDRWGVPHIYAHSDHDVYMAQGYVHAQDRLWQMEFSRRIAAGRLSEVLGEPALDSDRWLRTVGLYRAAQTELQDLPNDVLACLQSYADGVNVFISTHRNHLPIEFQLLAFAPEPWTPTDTLAWGKVIALSLGGNWESEIVRLQLIASLGEEKVLQLLPAYPHDALTILPVELGDYGSLDTSLLTGYRQAQELTGYGGEFLGSNNWVVDGTKTTSGRPILANDPHLSVQMPSIWYEVHLATGSLDVTGVSFPGCPGVIIGHNRSIAWGVTNSGADVQDLYVEKINPDNPDQYQFQGEWQDMTVVSETIWVKGRPEPELLSVRLTRHGPLLTTAPSRTQQPVALRWTALEGGGVFGSVYLLNRAGNWEEFRDALRSWNAPSQNFVYADAEGNIGYQLPGQIPVRARGAGMVPVPGWTGEYEWTGYIPYDELPTAFNPATHYLVTASNKVVSDAYPYFISADWAEPSRATRINELLEARTDLTVDDMLAIQADTYSIPATRVMPYVLALQPEGWLQERALRFFEGWDNSLTKDSGAAGIAEVVTWRILVNTFADEVGAVEITSRTWANALQGLFNILDQPTSGWFDDVGTLVVEDRDAILRKSVLEAMQFWNRRYGDLVGNLDSQWAWGKVHTVTFAHPLGAVKPLDLLLSRGPLSVPGSWCTVNATAYEPESFEVVALPSYRQVVDVGNWENSLSQITTGQSGQALHPHYDDMISSWLAVQPHEMLYEREDLLQQSEGGLLLKPAP
jgi:penicillin amidase